MIDCKIARYKIVSGVGHKILEQIVEHYLQHGWYLQGGPYADTGLHYQCLVQYEEPLYQLEEPNI